jgi:uncharacterized protein (TIGR00288 family)
MAEQVRKDVAVFIDFENIYVSVRDKLDTNPNFEIIMDRCNELGRVILARAYADWYRYPRITSALYANNIEPMYVPTYYYDKDAGRTGRPIKNSVDMNLCIEAMRTLFTMPGLSTFVLITGDRDFIPLVNSIRQQGKDVIIIGVGGAASSHLAQSADEFIFYEHLIGKQIATAASTPTNRRYSEIDEFERPARDRATPAVQRASRAESTKTDKPERKEKEATGLTEDAIWEMLAKAVVEARARSIVPSVGSLKTLVRELSNGEFRESMVRDANGRPLERFRDVVQEAAKRGKLIISTDSIVNEIFLPGEDPRTLSSFNVPMEKPPERAEEPLPSVQAANEARSAANQATNDKANDKSRRRRRNDRDNKRPQTPVATPVISVDAVTPVVDEYTIATPEPVAVVVTPAPEQPVPVETPVQPNGVPFSDEERQMVRDIVASSERALSFQQIYDALRSTRNRGGEQQIPRTNEELRSLVKSIINAGELQRIGRGNRVSYRMAHAKTPKTDAVVASDEGADVSTTADTAPVNVVAAEPVSSVVPPTIDATAPVMVPTPADLGDLDDGLSLPPIMPAKSTVPAVTSADVPALVTPAKPKKNTGRNSAKGSAPSSRTPKQPKQSTQVVANDTAVATKPVVSSAPNASSKTTARRDNPSSSTKQRSTKPKSTSARTKPVAVEAKSAVQSVPSPVDAPPSVPKPRRRKQTPES